MKVFIVTPIDVWCPNFVKFGQREIGEIVRCLPDQNKNKISPGTQAVATGRIAPKICQGQPPIMCSKYFRFHPNRFIFGGVIAERVNTVFLSRRVFPLFDRSIASRRITNRPILWVRMTFDTVSHICRDLNGPYA